MCAERLIGKGLFERDGVLYFRMRWNGRLYRAKCMYQGAAAFTSRGGILRCVEDALDIWQASIRTGEYARAREEKKLEAAIPTLEALCVAYKAAAAEQYASSGSPRPGTVTGNVGRLRGIAGEMGVLALDTVDKLTVAALRTWMRDKVFASGADQEAQARTRYSCWRSVAVAKSVWAPWARDAYAAVGIQIPDCLLAWPHPPRGAAAAPQVQIPSDELMAATIEAYDALEASNPRLWLAATMVLMFGMRPRVDGSRAEWAWFSKRGDEWWLEYTPSKTRGRTTEGSAVVSIRLPTALYERMRRANPKDGYVIDADCDRDRWDVFARDLCAWQRGNGWDPKKYHKPAYMLRKLCASAVAKASGGNVQTAAAVLGISVATVIKHYAADFRTQQQSFDVANVIRAAAAPAPVPMASTPV